MQMLALRHNGWTKNRQLSDRVADLIAAAREAEGGEGAGSADGPRSVADIQKDIQDTVVMLTVRYSFVHLLLLADPILPSLYIQVEGLAEHRKVKLQGEENSYKLELEVTGDLVTG